MAPPTTSTNTPQQGPPDPRGHDDGRTSPSLGDPDLFTDPPDFYPPTPPPTTQHYTLLPTTTTTSPQHPQQHRQLTLRLVGASPSLEAHTLWNGARSLARFLESAPRPPPIRPGTTTVLELGAAAGLPSLVAGLLGARRVVATDYPDPELVANLQINIDAAGLGAAAAGGGGEGREGEGEEGAVVVARGFVWGSDPAGLLAELGAGCGGFDVLLLADLLFRHAEHGALVRTITQTLARGRGRGPGEEGGRAYVFFTSYRPWLRERDLGFFDVCRAAGLVVEQVLEEKLERPLFEDDPGDEEVLRTVSGFMVRWPEDEVESGQRARGAS